MFKNWIEVFRAGKQTDSAGNVREWTEADLDTMVAKYDPAKHEAPVVIGHPKDNSPAFAWVEGLKREGDLLLAKIKDAVPEFAEAVGKKMYKKRSIALYPDLSLRHIGFLGGMPPAVKGLADLSFAEGEEFAEMEFQDWDLQDTAALFTGLRDYLIEKEGLEVADKVLPAYTIDGLKRSAAAPEMDDCPSCGASVPKYSNFCPSCGSKMKPEGDPAPAFSDPDPQDPPADDPPAGDPAAEVIDPPAPGEHSEPSDREKALEKELAAERKKTRTIEFGLFCDGLVEGGQLPPGMKAGAVEFMELVHGVESFEFAEGEGSALDRFKAFLVAMPKRLPGEFTEVPGEPAADLEDPNVLATKALEYQEQEKGRGRYITISEAVDHIKKEN